VLLSDKFNGHIHVTFLCMHSSSLPPTGSPCSMLPHILLHFSAQLTVLWHGVSFFFSDSWCALHDLTVRYFNWYLCHK